MKELQEKFGSSILMITHDLGVIAETADHVAVMYAGQIVEEGTVDDLFHDPQHPYTEGLLRSIPHIGRREERLAVIPGLVPSPMAWPEACRFEARCPYSWGKCVAEAPPLAEPPVSGARAAGRKSRCWLTEEPERRAATLARGGGYGFEVGDPAAVEARAPGEPVAVGPVAAEPGTPGEPILEVRDLTMHFPIRGGAFLGRAAGVVRAVDGISFELQRGETLGLVGESGCGKTTTGRSILRLVQPTAGSVRFEGREVTELDARELRALRRRVQIIFQDPYSSLNPRLTVGDALREVLGIHDLARGEAATRRIAELLDRVGLRPEQAVRYPHEFSGGQRQRIGIARALAVEPDLIVCDEPVSALDVSVQAQVINLLEALQEELGLTYLFIAHDLSVVRHISDRVAVMYLGKIVELAEVDTLFENPLMPYTQALLSAVPVPDPRRRPERILLPGDVPSSSEQLPGCPFYPRCPNPLKDEACLEAVPPLEDKGGGQLAACVKVPAEG
jgi:oligopeptide/dipeptide ABC transporter ATP-binding protein